MFYNQEICLQCYLLSLQIFLFYQQCYSLVEVLRINSKKCITNYSIYLLKLVSINSWTESKLTDSGFCKSKLFWRTVSVEQCHIYIYIYNVIRVVKNSATFLFQLSSLAVVWTYRWAQDVFIWQVSLHLVPSLNLFEHASIFWLPAFICELMVSWKVLWCILHLTAQIRIVCFIRAVKYSSSVIKFLLLMAWRMWFCVETLNAETCQSICKHTLIHFFLVILLYCISLQDNFERHLRALCKRI